MLGPSGSGKSTILRCLAGFEDISEGEILIGEEQINKTSIEKRNVGMVFQNYALFPHMTVRENVSFGLKMKKVPKKELNERVDRVLKQLGINQFEKNYPKQLSGGQQQRVALARVLVTNPRVMLLDEPLANLDAKLREEMRFYIRSLQREVGITTIFVTHDQIEAIELADRIGVMFDGELHSVSTPEELYRRPSSRKVAEFIGSTNLIKGVVKDYKENRVIVDSEIGELISIGQNTLKDEDPVFISVRPEDLKISEGNSQVGTTKAGVNYLQGTVKDSVFLGNVSEYLVDIPNDQKEPKTIRVHDTQRKLLPVGSDITINFHKDDSWMVTE